MSRKWPGTPLALFVSCMRQTSIILLFAFVVAGASPALAQRRVPNTGMGTIGVSVGAALPTESNLENGLGLAGSLEGYLTPRVSIRGQVGTAWLDFTGAPATRGRCSSTATLSTTGRAASGIRT
jgi:hypothetical protein